MIKWNVLYVHFLKRSQGLFLRYSPTEIKNFKYSTLPLTKSSDSIRSHTEKFLTLNLKAGFKQASPKLNN